MTKPSQAVDVKQSIVSAFLERFTLTDLEKEALISRDSPISELFFSALDRSIKIKDECALLLGEGLEESRAG